MIVWDAVTTLYSQTETGGTEVYSQRKHTACLVIGGGDNEAHMYRIDGDSKEPILIEFMSEPRAMLTPAGATITGHILGSSTKAKWVLCNPRRRKEA